MSGTTGSNSCGRTAPRSPGSRCSGPAARRSSGSTSRRRSPPRRPASSPRPPSPGSARTRRRGPTSPTTRPRSWTTGWCNLDGKVYSLGGGDGSASTAKNYAYDPAAQTWTAIADLPGARNALTVGVVDGKIIATGGWGDAGPDSATWSYDPGANTWTELADNPAPRAAAGQAVVDGKLYAVGGCTTADCLPMSNSVVRYDPAGEHVGDDGQLPEVGGLRLLRRDRRHPLLHRRQRRFRLAEVQLRLRPGCQHLDGDRRRAGRQLGQLVRRRQRQAARRRWLAGWGHQQRRLRLRPGRRLVVQPAERQHGPLPRWRGVRLLQDRRFVRQLQRGGRTARCSRASRGAPSRRPTSAG